MKKPDHDAKPGILDRCQITGSKNLFEGIDLGHQPPCSALLTEKTLREPETYYPLRLMISPESGLGQLDYVVEGKTLFPIDYSYRPGISKPLLTHLELLAKQIVDTLELPPKSLCIDIGSNDGTLLTYLRNHGMKPLGIEPTDMAKTAWKENKIETIQKFFDEATGRQVAKEYGKAHAIAFTNVFAHIGELGEVMRGLTHLLAKDGAVVAESQYLLDVLEGNQFDEIYHDHVRIYSLHSLVKLFPYYDMEVFDAYRIPSREGSIRVYAGWKGQRPINPRVKKLLDAEQRASLFAPSAWAKFRKRVQENREVFLELAYKAKIKGTPLVADSCPTRGVVLMNYYGLDKTLVPYIAQLPGTEKVGKYMPGTHQPIVDNTILLKEKPEYIFILAWHYGDYIIKNWRTKGLKSKFVLPLPRFQIVK